MLHGCPNPALEAVTQPGFLSYQERTMGSQVKVSSTWKVRDAGWTLANKDGPASAPKASVNPIVRMKTVRCTGGNWRRQLLVPPSGHPWEVNFRFPFFLKVYNRSWTLRSAVTETYIYCFPVTRVLM